MHMKRGDANLYLFVTHRGAIVHTVTEQRAAPPPLEGDSFTVAGLRVDIERPLERFRLRYAHGSTAFDLTWEGMSPTYKYPTPPSDEFPGHIEQGGRVTGTVTLGGVPMPFDGPGHRDHSWGGERDWAKFHRWTYLSGEFGGDFWFNAVRIHLGEQVDVRIGCLWDGRELLSLQEHRDRAADRRGWVAPDGRRRAPHRRARARAPHRRRGGRRQLSRSGWDARC